MSFPIQRLLLSKAAKADFAHCVIGGGVVGLAVAARLAKRGPTILLERHSAPGTETSSRNSEVIHAGLYYPINSLKTELCIRGKEMLYEVCEKHSIPHKKLGKWVVAQDDEQRETLQGIYDHAKKIGVPVRFLSDKEIQEEPEVHSPGGALLSPTTGIVSAHDLMTYLNGIFEENEGDLALEAQVTSIEKVPQGYEITAGDSKITAAVLINSAGLGAINIANMLLPEKRKAYYAKGTYFSYSKKLSVKHLVYPCPVANLGGLGTHLTLDMGGRARFGPDVEWVDDPSDLQARESRLNEAVDAVRKYLPNIDKSLFSPDYCGIRPKLTSKTYHDFLIQEETGFPGFVNLLGIESPGLTSSLAIAEKVEKLLY